MAATIKVIDIIRRAEKILSDDSAVRWKRLELQDWINDAYREIVDIDIEANAQLASVSLATGAHQDLTDTGSINLPAAMAVLDVKRNVAATSNKRPVTVVDGAVMDQMVPDWRAATASISIRHWMPDGRVQTEFDVYPPAATGAQLEIMYASTPAQHALTESALDPAGADTTVISLDDSYTSAVLDYVLYRALIRESDSPTASNLAAFHWNTFRASMGIMDKPMKLPRPSQPRQPEAKE